MDVSEAARLIRFNRNSEEIQLWADLGCGTGTFTYALASHLPPQSTIYAVDQSEQNLRSKVNGVEICYVQMDFSKGIDSMPELHGVLMANSLHYIKDKSAFLEIIRQKLTRNKRQLLVVEYETEVGNNWVPYPVTFSQLKKLVIQQGATKVEKIDVRPSRYQGEMYAAIIEFN